jgi:hypothetical protein
VQSPHVLDDHFALNVVILDNQHVQFTYQRTSFFSPAAAGGDSTNIAPAARIIAEAIGKYYFNVS